jgi:hypothetical protein
MRLEQSWQRQLGSAKWPLMMPCANDALRTRAALGRVGLP